MNDNDEEMKLQTTQPTCGGAVTAVTNCRANCVETAHPHQWGHDLCFLSKPVMRTRWMAGAATHKKRVISRQIQVRQLNTIKSVFAISAINKYMVGGRYRQGTT